MSYSYMSYMLHMVCIYIYIYIHITCYIYAILRPMIYDRYVVTVASHGSHGSEPSRRRDHRGARVISCADVGAAGEHLRASAAAESCR